MNNPAKDNWKVLIGEQEEVLTNVSVVGGKIYANYLKDASTHIYIHALDGTREGELELPGIGTASSVIGKKDDEIGFYSFTSFIYPSTTFKLDTKTGTSEVYRKSGVDFDPEQYTTEQVFFQSKDGTQVPTLPFWLAGAGPFVPSSDAPTHGAQTEEVLNWLREERT